MEIHISTKPSEEEIIVWRNGENVLSRETQSQILKFVKEAVGSEVTDVNIATKGPGTRSEKIVWLNGANELSDALQAVIRGFVRAKLAGIKTPKLSEEPCDFASPWSWYRFNGERMGFAPKGLATWRSVVEKVIG